MNIKKVLEKHGFKVEKMTNYWFISQYTPAGEDWGLSFNNLDEVKEYAENYEPNEDFKMLYEAGQNGLRGVPDVPELWQDQLWKQEVLNMVLEDLQ